jgi:hypothetical protein
LFASASVAPIHFSRPPLRISFALYSLFLKTLMASIWGSLLSDIWKYIASTFLTLGALRKIARLNSKFLGLARACTKGRAYRVEFAKESEPMTHNIRTVSSPRNPIKSIFSLFSNPNRLLIAEAVSDRVKLHDPISGTLSVTLFPRQPAKSFSDFISFRGDRFVGVTWTSIVTFAPDGKPLTALVTPSGTYRVNMDCITSNIFVSTGSTVQVYDPEMVFITEIACPNPSGVAAHNGKLYAISFGSRCNIFDVETGQQSHSFLLDNIATSLLIDSGGTLIIPQSAGITLYNEKTGKATRKISCAVRRCTLLPRGDIVAVTAGSLIIFSEPIQ